MLKITRKLDFSGEIFSIFLALIIMCVFFSFTSPYFFTIKNILNVIMNSSILGIMAAGLFISMVIGEIDVSQYSILALSTAVMAILIQSGTGIGLAITISMIVALICGAINGASVAFLRINPIITTLGTMLIYRAIAYKITEAKAMGVEGDFFSAVGGRFLGIPVSVYIMLSVYIIVYVCMYICEYMMLLFVVCCLLFIVCCLLFITTHANTHSIF